MKLTPRKNNYGHMVIDCPFCADFVYLQESRHHQPDRLSNLKRHITNQARNEALEWYLAGSSIPCPHLEYLKAHTEPKVVKLLNKRQFDNDLTI